MKKGDIAVSTVMILVIVTISAVLLIGFFGLMFPTFGNQIYCKTIFQITSSRFFPESMHSDDSLCKEQQNLSVSMARLLERESKLFYYHEALSSLAYVNLTGDTEIIYIELPNGTQVTNAVLTLYNGR